MTLSKIVLGIGVALATTNLFVGSIPLYIIAVVACCAGFVLWKVEELKDQILSFRKSDTEYRKEMDSLLKRSVRPSTPHNNMVTYHQSDGTKTVTSSNGQHTLVIRTQPPASNE